MYNVFVYGSLLFREMVEKLCGKTVEMKQASLPGYKRFAVKGAEFPAIVKDETSKVEGKLILNLSKKDLDILTFYEGDEYECTPVEVQTEKEEIILAHAFTWIAGLEKLFDFDWNAKTFEEEALKLYINEIIPQTIKEFNELKNKDH